MTTKDTDAALVIGEFKNKAHEVINEVGAVDVFKAFIQVIYENTRELQTKLRELNGVLEHISEKAQDNRDKP